MRELVHIKASRHRAPTQDSVVAHCYQREAARRGGAFGNSPITCLQNPGYLIGFDPPPPYFDGHGDQGANHLVAERTSADGEIEFLS